MRINVFAHEILEREVSISAALSAHIALLATEGREAPLRDPAYHERIATSRDLLSVRVGELGSAQEARAIVEDRYLAGHTALFPAAVTAWDEQLKRTEAIANMAVRLGELDGVRSAWPADPAAVTTRVHELAADLVEPAKTTALEKLGEGERAQGIATRWLRTKLAPSTDVAFGSPATAGHELRS